MDSAEAEPVGSRGEKEAAAISAAESGSGGAGPDAPRDVGVAVTGERGKGAAAVAAGGIMERRRRAKVG